jgi:oxygen-dependent protoporphyrinogen oxidase
MMSSVETISGERRHVVIVGGGISGLAAAHRLLGGRAAADREGAAAPRVTLLEADERLGGKIRTERFAGRQLDVGAEALLARVPAGLELCNELGLEHDLVEPADDRPLVWTDRLRALPPRLMAGVPDGSRSVLASGILSPAGRARAGLDLVVPSRVPARDVAIGELVRGRLGDQVLERLIGPLLGGIHAGSCDELSTRAVAPQFEAALRTRRGLVRGLRTLSRASAPAAAGPIFLTLGDGLQEMVGALRESLHGVEVRTGAAAQSLEPLPGARVRLTLRGGEQLLADHVLLAAPAFAAATILSEACPRAAGELADIRYASVATIALSYAPESFERPPAGSGFLVERGRARTITACTWSSSKWAHLAGDTVLLKCSAGHAGDRSALDLDDDQLIGRVREDLERAMGLRAEPAEARVFRFERALPQYAVDHLERIARIEGALQALPSVRVCGAAYHGVGVASCIRDARVAADSLRAALLEQSIRVSPRPVRPAPLRRVRSAHRSTR